MKKLLIITIAVFFTNGLCGQSWDEWFRQKQTQKKYNLQQLAALHVYAGYLSKGYTIAKNGLGTIQGLKHGDFNLHSNYLSSLTLVNPKIKRYNKVADIIAMQLSIGKQTHNAIKSFSNSHQFTASELNYIKDVISTLLTDCVKSLDELYILITNGNLQMKDNERILAINKLYTDMQDKQVFTNSFLKNARVLAVQRRNEENDIIISKKISGLK